MRYLFLFVVMLILIPIASAQDIVSEKSQTSVRISSGEVIYGSPAGTVVVKTLIDDARFIGSDVNIKSANTVKYASNEKSFLLFDDPIVQQQYEYKDDGSLEDTVYLKEPKKLSYQVSVPAGGYLALQPDGSVRIINPAVDEVTEGYNAISPAVGMDVNGQGITFGYEIVKDTLLVVVPKVGDGGKELAYPISIDPTIYHVYDLKLLLHGNLEPADSLSTSIVRDSSRSAKMPAFIIPAGGVGNNNITSPKFGNASIFLKNGASVNITDSADFTLGTNNFTICTWMKTPAYLSMDFYNHQASTGAAAADLFWYYSATDRIYWTNYAGTESATSAVLGGSKPPVNTWNRYCTIKNGTAVKVYINSTEVATGAVANSADVNGVVSIGQNVSALSPGGWHLDDFVFINGLGLPITSPLLSSEYPLFVNATPTNLGYADDNSTVSLLHFDGVGGRTFFRDEVGNRTVVAGGAANTSTNTVKFSNTSLFLGGVSGSYVNITAPGTSFNYGVGDFTEDFWLNMTSYPTTGYTVPYVRLNGTSTSGNISYLVFHDYGGGTSIRLYMYDNGVYIGGLSTVAAGSLPPVNTWAHYALVRNGSSLKMFINGTLAGTGTFSGNIPNAAYGVHLGGSSLSSLWTIDGYMDEYRSSNIARWTANFTPPTDPYELVQNVTFTATPEESGTAPATVQFNVTDPSGAWTQNTYFWEFGDGGTSTDRDASHTYTTTGLFNATLVTMNNNMSNISTFDISVGRPVPDFSASPMTGTAALEVRFTDATTNTTPITAWLLDFGDGEATTDAPDAAGGWTHVYSSYGAFSPNLTATNTYGTSFEYKRDYIVVSTEQNPPQVQSYPQFVAFEVRSGFGAVLSDVNVTMSPVSTSTGNYDWLVQLVGIPLDEVPLSNETLTALTDTMGVANFYAIPTTKYNCTFIKSGYTIPSMLIVPTEKRYVVFAQLNASEIFGEDINDSNISVIVSGVKHNTTTAYINWTLEDTKTSVTGGTIQIYADNTTIPGGDDILVAEQPITSSSCSNSTTVPIGDSPTSYKVHVNASSSLESDYVIFDTTVGFSGHIEFLGFSGYILLWLAFIIIMLLALSAGVETGAAVSFVVCIAAWLLFMAGWLDEMGASSPLGMTGVLAALTLATFFSIVWNFREGMRKELGR